MRSETRMRPKCRPKGFTQKWSSRSGSRAVMWPATPSSKPKREKRRKAAARRSLRWRRSSAGVAKTGGRGTRSMKVLWAGEAADVDGCGMGTSVMQSVGEGNCASARSSWKERNEERLTGPYRNALQHEETEESRRRRDSLGIRDGGANDADQLYLEEETAET